MDPARARRSLHAAHALATVALLLTGVLIQWPDLRARMVGGYGRELARIHVWLGWAFAAAPGIALSLAARPLLRDLRRRLGPPDPLGWRQVHIAVSLAASAALVGSGVVLWWPGDLPLAVQDAGLEVHVWATGVLAVVLPLHLIAARRKIAHRLRHPLGDDVPPLFELADEDGEPPA